MDMVLTVTESSLNRITESAQKWVSGSCHHLKATKSSCSPSPEKKISTNWLKSSDHFVLRTLSPMFHTFVMLLKNVLFKELVVNGVPKSLEQFQTTFSKK